MSKVKSRECQNVEYKTSWHDKYLEWVCGFANAQGAVMYFGVNDDHEVVGIDNVDRLMEDIPNKIVNHYGYCCGCESPRTGRAGIYRSGD